VYFFVIRRFWIRGNGIRRIGRTPCEQRWKLPTTKKPSCR